MSNYLNIIGLKARNAFLKKLNEKTKNKVLIIAEAGVNHNGSLKIAKKLVDVAKSAGADIVLSLIHI